MNSPLAVVLAAGMGTRMKSDLPKVLCPVCGQPMVKFVLAALRKAGVERMVVVVGYRADDVRAALADEPGLTFVEQTERLGTGHAVKMARAQLAAHEGPALIVTGDSPLVQPASLKALLKVFREKSPACLLGTLHKADPAGLGRIVRDSAGNFKGIVEEKDATDAERQITEVNMSTYVFYSQDLVQALDLLKNDNRQKEYYVTDCPGILQRAGKLVLALPILQPCEALSINTPEELAVVEAEMQKLRMC